MAFSPATAARQMVTRVISMSSSAQPVNGTAPVTPVVLFAGVSTTPIGAADVPCCFTVSATATEANAFPGAVSVSWIDPSTSPGANAPAPERH